VGQQERQFVLPFPDRGGQRQFDFRDGTLDRGAANPKVAPQPKLGTTQLMRLPRIVFQYSPVADRVRAFNVCG
jgi:hypothetical protein